MKNVDYPKRMLMNFVGNYYPIRVLMLMNDQMRHVVVVVVVVEYLEVMY